MIHSKVAEPLGVYSVCGQGILYKDERFMAAFPALCVTHEGQILLVFRRAPDSRWLLQSTHEPVELEDLGDCLYHWDPRSQLASLHFEESDLVSDLSLNPCGLSVDPQSADQDASLLTLDDGSILLTSFSWYPMPPAFSQLVKAWGGRAFGGPKNVGGTFIPWGSYTRMSRDHGQTFDERHYLPPLPNSADLVPGLRTTHGGNCRGQAIVREGEILMPSYALLGNAKGTSTSQPAQEHTAHLFVSKDDGEHWEYRSMIACDSKGLGFFEPSLTLCDDGSVVCFMRTNDSSDRMATARSDDGGHTWHAAVLQETVGHPAHCLRLRDGRQFLSYGYRHEGHYGVRARLLNALASDVDDTAEIILRSDGLCSDVGYPWAVELSDSRILVAYYFTAADGLRHIAYSLVGEQDPSPHKDEESVF